MVEVRKQDWGEGATREEGKGVPIRRGVGGRSQWGASKDQCGRCAYKYSGRKRGQQARYIAALRSNIQHSV